MARCPNCGQKTTRTKDWACCWCGYPLFSEAYKKIDKTYRELREGASSRQPVVEGTVIEGSDKAEVEPAVEPGPEPEIKSEVKPVSETEPESGRRRRPKRN